MFVDEDLWTGSMTDPDELYTLRNRFWLGNFQMAIAEGNALTRLSDPLKTERDEFVYRSYVGLGQYGLVIGEIGEESPIPLQAVKLLAQYLEDPAGNKEMVLMTIGEWVRDPTSANVPTVQLMAALIYEKEGLMKEAFTAIRHGTTMEQLALWAQFCLKINRVDLAQKHLKKLTDVDEDATLTQLVSAWVNLSLGGDKCKEACYAYEELIDKFEPSLSLLNGLAVSKMHLREWEDAEKSLLAALAKSFNDADTLINIITCYAHMGKDQQLIDRYTNQLKSAHPNHPHVVKLNKAEEDFDKLAKEYADREIPPEDRARADAAAAKK